MAPQSALVAEAVAASASGCAATLLGHPLDCLKVRMQAEQQSSAMQTFLRMLKQDGVAAFARGMGPPLLNAVLMNTAMFVVFAECRRRTAALGDVAGALASGAFAGVATATLSTPFDYVKIQSQLRGAPPLRVLADALRARALFRGHAANCLREGVFTAVYLGAYDACRVALSGGGDRPPTRVVAAVAATTGALAWVANYPFDTVKSVQQSAPPSAPRAGLARAVRTLWRRGGAGAFYAGLAPSTARAVLVTTSRLVAYEHVRGWFDAPR